MKTRWIAIATVLAGLVVVAVAVISFRLDGAGALSNLLAELAGLAAAFIAGLLLFDRLAERGRAAQWAKVRGITIRGIAARLAAVAVSAYIHLPLRDLRGMTLIQEGADKPSERARVGFRRLAQQVGSLTEGSSRRPDTSTSDLVVEFYEASAWDLDQIQLVLFPRVIESSGNQRLIDALTDFDEARRTLHDAIIGDKAVVTGAPFPACIDLLESGTRLYDVLCEVWNE